MRLGSPGRDLLYLPATALNLVGHDTDRCLATRFGNDELVAAPGLWLWVDNGAVTDLPRNAVTRTAKLASLPLGFAGRKALGTAKRMGGAPAEAVLAEVQIRTAEQLFKTLGELKGGAMKFGQALSIMEGALPEELAKPYRAHLTKLQDSAPPMTIETIKHVLAAELGPRWNTRIIELRETPAASASIGQVHRGVWSDGREVAIKVQYPGADEAMRSDLKQLSRLARTLGGFLPGIDAKPLIEELQHRVLEELDYRLEAEAQRRYAEVYADDPDYVVPQVVAGTERVLVTEWLDSPASLAQVIADGTQAERDRYGELFARWIFGSPPVPGCCMPTRIPATSDSCQGGESGHIDSECLTSAPSGDFPTAAFRTTSDSCSPSHWPMTTMPPPRC